MQTNHLFQPALGRNQLANAHNPYQSDRKKVLCVCSAGLLRSTTIAAYLSKNYGYNVRNCGTSQEYALIPLSEALLHWADEIHVVAEQEHHVRTALDATQAERYKNTRVVVLDIPDQYSAFDEELLNIIDEFYKTEYDGEKYEA